MIRKVRFSGYETLLAQRTRGKIYTYRDNKMQTSAIRKKDMLEVMHPPRATKPMRHNEEPLAPDFQASETVQE
jgi:hypothetical protein